MKYIKLTARKVKSTYPAHLQKWHIYSGYRYLGHVVTGINDTEEGAINEYRFRD